MSHALIVVEFLMIKVSLLYLTMMMLYPITKIIMISLMTHLFNTCLFHCVTQRDPLQKKRLWSYWIWNVSLLVGYYLPSTWLFNAEFAQQVLAGTKQLFKKSQVKFVSRIYKYPECSKLNLYNAYPQKPLLAQYIPDGININAVGSDYLFNVR